MKQKPMKNKNPNCPNCNRESIKAGKRKNKLQTIQIYQCKNKNCKNYNKKFTSQQSKTTYPINIILTAISTYNLGYSLKKTSKIINKKFKTNISIKTIHNWLNKYNFPYHRLRNEAIKSYTPKNIIFKTPLNHKQIYIFKYHKAKIDLILEQQNNQKFNLIKDYLLKISTEKFPHHIFRHYNEENDKENIKEQSRASQIDLQTLESNKLKKQNYANILTKLALNLAENNKQRHQIIQDFFLINDSKTIAVEIPVYLTNNDIKYFGGKGFVIKIEDYKTPITGHIDILQLRNSLIHILDYKPEANRNSIQESSIKQLAIYALALASKTKLAVKDFKCAFFNENFYYEFFPLPIVYEKRDKND